MAVAENLRNRLLTLVPDEPTWIEARAALLDPGSRLFGDERGFIVRSDSQRLAGIVGDSSEVLIREALADIADAGSDPTALWAVVEPGGFSPAAQAALRGWRTDEADIFREPAGGLSLEDRASSRPSPVCWMRPEEAGLLDGLAEPLVAELREALGRSEVAAAWVDSRPVSFCSIACESERLWDISINTAAEYRRRGLAGECVAWLTAEMRKRGKRAVWGAHSENVASRRLASRLGFEPSGKLCLYENEVIR